MSLSIAQMRSPFTRGEALEWLLEVLQSAGFDTTGWQNGRIQKSLMLMFATAYSDHSEVVRDLVEFGFNDYATGDPLNLFSQSRYDNTKVAAVRTKGIITLTSKATIPYTIQPGQLLAATSYGTEFRNLNGGTLAAGGTLPLTFEARVAGSGGNVPAADITRLLTSLAGVTVSATGSPWYSVTGADEESDSKIQQRNTTKWSRQNRLQLIRDAAINLALENGAGKVTVDDNNPRGPFTANVYCAAEDGALGPTELAAIQLAFSKVTWHSSPTWPAAPDSEIAVLVPVEYPLDITVQIFHDATRSSADVLTDARQALHDLLRRTPIGGVSYPPNFTNVLPAGDLSQALEDVQGVQTAIFQGLANPTLLNPLQVVIEGTWQIECIPVATGNQ
jgi:uncharacterized phage protein gp47/JayE